jgi:sigma-B regulation protein RsbU (phosphoserine phosphatase)
MHLHPTFHERVEQTIDTDLLQREMRAIGQLQRLLLPELVPQPAGWHLAASYLVSPWPGGDYYDFFPLPGDRLALLIADASGHGGPAAVMVAQVRVLLHSCPLTSARRRSPFCPLDGGPQGPAIVLGHLDGILKENSLEDQFMTAFYALLDLKSGGMQYANAGHPPPRLWRRSTGEVVAVAGQGGPPLGMGLAASYAQDTCSLEPEDVLVGYSDGLVEAFDEREELFGLERLDAAIRGAAPRGAEAVKDEVWAALDQFLKGRDPHDDVTLIALERTP